MTYFREADYSDVRARPKLLTNYVESLKTHLCLMHPNEKPDVIEGFIKNMVREKMIVPDINFVHHPREGISEVKDMKLTEFVPKIVADNNLSPSGTMYYPVSKKESFLRQSLVEKVAERNKYKHLYLDNEAQGNVREAQYYYHSQANAKIFNNAIAGGMNIIHFILGCKAGFNAITSIGRMCVKQGYSFIERALVGNIYLPTNESVVSYIVTAIRHIHPDFEAMLAQYNIYLPTAEDVFKYLTKSLLHYTFKVDHALVMGTIQALNATQRAYVFYLGALSNMCRFNPELMRKLIDDCFVHGDITEAMYEQFKPEDVKSFRGDIVAAVLSVNYSVLGTKGMKDGKPLYNSLKDAKESNPTGLRVFAYCCQTFKDGFEKMVPILKPILQIKSTFAKMTFQDRIAREAVILSDTDSNIYTAQEIVQWKRGGQDFSQESYQMNALATYILSQSLEHVFARLSAGFGVESNDVYMISMKNEFLYPVLVSTSLAKHYLAIATMQEGSLLPSPRRDIKGVGFRSSAYPKKVKQGFEDFYVKFVEMVMSGAPIYASYLLDHVAKLEREIERSIRDRESDYLQTVAVRLKEDYEEPESSNYFYHILWNEVFAQDFGEMVLPNKCFKIPLLGGDKFIKNKALHKLIADKYPEIWKRLSAFMERNPQRKFSSFLIPPFKGSTNEFFMDVMDMRSHISQALTSYYHLLDGLGIGTVDRRQESLVSDYYKPSGQW
jgi:hypothetical protein